MTRGVPDRTGRLRFREYTADDLGLVAELFGDPQARRFYPTMLQDVSGASLLEVGYHLIHEHRGRGYATEAAAACRDHAFDVVDADTVGSIVDPHNGPSIAVASRIHATHTRFVDSDGHEMLLFTTERRHRRP